MTGPDRPLGATPSDGSTTFRLFSGAATAVDLCLFDDPDGRETARLSLASTGDGVWEAVVPGVEAGQNYGYRVHGPDQPREGHRFNPRKLLIDPYARQLAGALVWEGSVYPEKAGDDRLDSAPSVPKAVVTRPSPVADTRPRRSWSETFIYEGHVKGLTWLHPDVPPEERGTYAALGHPAVVEHLTRLGVTALELLPIQAFVDDRFLVRRKLTNYWGYSTLAFFAPERRYGDGAGLKRAVTALHAAGIEVILDVVYNHTAELEETGPTLSLRGIDNATYYKPAPDDPSRTWNITGCGNTLNIAHPAVRRLVLDSLRHWVREYGIDGFRFDLGTVLARDPDEFDPEAAFLRELDRDPVLADTKLIAEPWDIAPDGYRLGRFPARWSEWNAEARDGIRRFWTGHGRPVPDLARALAGSREIAGAGRPGPRWSINYVASHDGFTLRDAVTFEEKHNADNGEGNRDGHNENFTWNCGLEGESAEPRIAGLRARQVRNHLATLFLSQGVPMLLMGDELSRTQRGNNNAYCQDNAVNWLDWGVGRASDPDLPEFVAALARLRRDHPGLRRTEFLSGTVEADGTKDVLWLRPDGREMTNADWSDPALPATLAMRLAPHGGGPAVLALFNAEPATATFLLPDEGGRTWTALLRSDASTGFDAALASGADKAGTFTIPSRSVVFLHCENPG